MSSQDEDKPPRAIANDARRARRERKVGEGEVCLLCGESNLWVLTKTTVRASALQPLLDEHHVVFVALDRYLVVILCRNCHAMVHAELWEEGIDPKLTTDETVPEVVAAIFLTLAVFLRLLADRVMAWAERLRAFVSALDTHVPGWRELPEAVW